MAQTPASGLPHGGWGPILLPVSGHVSSRLDAPEATERARHRGAFLCALTLVLAFPVLASEAAASALAPRTSGNTGSVRQWSAVMVRVAQALAYAGQEQPATAPPIVGADCLLVRSVGAMGPGLVVRGVTLLRAGLLSLPPPIPAE